VSIAKRVIEAHGGQIWVESPCLETGKGCKFTFTIPKNQKRETARGYCGAIDLTAIIRVSGLPGGDNLYLCKGLGSS